MVEPDWGSLCFRSLLETHRFQRRSGWMVRLFWEDSLILNYLEKVTNRREQVAILYPYHPIDSTNRCFPKIRWFNFSFTMDGFLDEILPRNKKWHIIAAILAWHNTHTLHLLPFWLLWHGTWRGPIKKWFDLVAVMGLGVLKACLANNFFYLQRLTHGHHLYPRYATYIPGIRCLFKDYTWSLAPLFHAKTKHDISIQGDSLFRCYQRVCPFDTINVFGGNLEDHTGFPLPNSLFMASNLGVIRSLLTKWDDPPRTACRSHRAKHSGRVCL